MIAHQKGSWAARLLVALAAPAVSFAIVAIAAAGGADPASQARTILGELASASASPASSNEAGLAPPIEAADEAIGKAKEALDRAEKLRAASDAKHAELAEDLALEWAETAHDLVAAVVAEREADQLAIASVSSTTKADRARTLLEEAIVRRARLQTALDDLDKQLADKALDAGTDAKPPKKKPVGGAP